MYWLSEKTLSFKRVKIFLNTDSQLQELKLRPDSNSSKKERRFLELLLKNKDLVTTYQMIDEFVYEDKTMSMDALRALVRRLRTKLEEDIIKNISDVGYSVK